MVPHATAVVVEEFKAHGSRGRGGERSEREQDAAPLTYIRAVIYVERESQKLIVLGKGGQQLKQIGQAARREIESLLDGRVYLDLWVKVRPKWRMSDEELRRLGYHPPKVPGARRRRAR